MQTVGMNFSVAFFIVLLGASLLFERGTYNVYLTVLICTMWCGDYGQQPTLTELGYRNTQIAGLLWNESIFAYDGFA